MDFHTFDDHTKTDPDDTYLKYITAILGSFTEPKKCITKKVNKFTKTLAQWHLSMMPHSTPAKRTKQLHQNLITNR
jgi:hypothetical protein